MMTMVVIMILIVMRMLTMPQLCIMLSGRRVDVRLSLRMFVQRLGRESFLVPLFLLLSAPTCKLLRSEVRPMRNISGNEKLLLLVFFRGLLKFDSISKP
jgi:hypothetical protein